MGSHEKMNEFNQKKAADSTWIGNAADNACIRRVRSLLDEESFVEVNRFVQARGMSHGFDRPKVDGDGVRVGYGTIAGRRVFVASQDPTVYAGSMGQMHAEKISGIIQMAIDANAPFIGIYDTGGARIEEGILALEGLSGVLSSLNEASGRIPTMAAILGPCLGGSAMAAGLSDFRFMTETSSGLYMNGPMVTAAAEGKAMEPSDIGGARIHATLTGLATFTSNNENECLQSVKTLLGYLPDHPEEYAVDYSATDDPNRVEDRLNEIAGILDGGYDMQEILRLVADNDTILELSKDYAPGILTAFAKLDGITVGVIASNAPRMDASMAKKATVLTCFCDKFRIPVVSLVDCEGFAIGIGPEHSNIIQTAADLYRAMDSSCSPRIGILIGKAIGTAYLALASKQSGCDFVFAWPTAEIAVVSPDTAANILYRKEIATSDDPITARAGFTNKYSDEIASAYAASSLGHVDEVIMPSSTRPRLISSLQILLS